MVNQVDDTVKEGDVMGNQDKCVLIFLKIPLQPFNVLGVQVVGGLIQKQDIRLL